MKRFALTAQTAHNTRERVLQYEKIDRYISLKILPYLTDFSPQLMACLKTRKHQMTKNARKHQKI